MRIDIPEEKKLVHEMVIPIRWGDMDAMGHVNNTVYFRYLESARIEWMASVSGFTAGKGEGPVVVNAFCNFHKQFEYPGDVQLRMYVSNPSRSSFDTWALMGRTDDPGVLYASAGATVVWVDYAAQKSRPLPEALRALL